MKKLHIVRTRWTLVPVNDNQRMQVLEVEDKPTSKVDGEEGHNHEEKKRKKQNGNVDNEARQCKCVAKVTLTKPLCPDSA